MKNKIAVVIILAMLAALFASCDSVSPVSAGDYYLDGDKNNPYIRINDDSTMRFVKFDIDYLASFLVEVGTDYTGKDAEDFMKRYNMPNVFQEEIAFDFDEAESMIYVKALTNSETDTNTDEFVVNYRMAYVDERTISFLDGTYTRGE